MTALPLHALKWSDLHDDFLIVRAEVSKNKKKGTVYFGTKTRKPLDELSIIKKNFILKNPDSNRSQKYSSLIEDNPYVSSRDADEAHVSFQGFNIRVNATIQHFLGTIGLKHLDQKTQEVEPSESSPFLKSALRDFAAPPLCSVRTRSDIDGNFTLIQVKRGVQTLDYHRTNRTASEIFAPKKGDLHGLFSTPKEFYDFARQKILLDIGCGGGAFVFDLRRNGINAFGVDLRLSPQSAHLDALVEGDAFSLPFKNESFHLLTSIWSVFSYEPPSRMRAILDEAYRVLKTDGILFLSPVLEEDKILILKKWSRQVKARILIEPISRAIVIQK